MCNRPEDKIMQQAVSAARITMNAGSGGPFGAAITDPNGTVIAVASNTVLGDHDPTAHAEINAIRKAGELLGTHDLTGCTLVATSYPCPMCLSAIIWANIKDVYFGCSAEDAGAIGFRDEFIYDYIRGGLTPDEVLRLHPLDKKEALALFAEYDQDTRPIY